MTITKPKIFISYNHSDKDLARTIENDISITGYEIIRDERDLKYTQDIESFMKTIRLCDFALILVSDNFLKSIACMYEISEFMKDESSFDRILPIVIKDYSSHGEFHKGGEIYSNKELTQYITYWELEEKKIREQLTKIDISNISNLAKELSRIIQVQKIVGDFIFLLRKIKHTNQEILKSSNYKELLERIGFGNRTIDDLRLSASYFGRAMAEFNPERRIVHLNKSIELNPFSERAFDQKGRSLDNLGRYKEAVEAYNKAIELNPNVAAYFVNRSYSYIRMGEFTLALNDANKSIEINPMERMSYNNRADIYRRLENYELGKKDIKTALSIEPTFDLAFATLAEIYAAEGKRIEFYENLRKAIDYGFPLFKYSFDEIYKEFENESEFKTLVELSKQNDRII